MTVQKIDGVGCGAKAIPIDFHGDTLFAVEQPDGVFVAIKPISDAVGLAWNAQHARITRDAILNEGMRIIEIPSPGGLQETTCLRLDLVNGWLFGISEGSIKDEAIRNRVLDYKRECYRVLFAHFHDRSVARTATPQVDDFDPDPVSPDGMKLRKVNTAARCFGERAGAQLWVKLGLEWVPAMAAALSQSDLLDIDSPPGTVTIKVTPNGGTH